MELRILPPALCEAAPGKIIPGSASHFGFKMLRKYIVPYDASLFNDFMAIRDYQTFSNFYRKYGLVGFAQPLKAAAKRDDSLEFLAVDFYSSAGISETHLKIAWSQLKPYIKRAQNDIQRVLRLRDEYPEKFCRGIEGKLKNVRLRFVYTKDGYLLFTHTKGFKAACLLQAALASEHDLIDICPQCGRRFIKTKNRNYCSETCKEQAKDNRRKNDPVEKKKRSLKGRLERRDLDSLEKEKVLAAIKRVKRPKDDGETQEALGRLGEIEERWLTRLTPGRQPSSKQAAVKK
jgi:hypothetical protein